MLKLIKLYLNLLSIIAPKYGGRVAFKLFQKTRFKKIKEKEHQFYEKAKPFSVPLEREALYCYEQGNPKGKLVFLVHGWDSNAGSLSRFATELSRKNYRVISFDLPAHAHSKLTHTNLIECHNAFSKLIAYINPKAPFNIISHSFGSTLSAYTLSESNYKLDKMVLLTSNNSIESVFLWFQNMIGFNQVIYDEFSKVVAVFFKEHIDDMLVSKRIAKIDYAKLLIIHDKYDKVLTFNHAEEILAAVPNAKLSAYEKIGHYRMLWNDDVVKETIDFIES